MGYQLEGAAIFVGTMGKLSIMGYVVCGLARAATVQLGCSTDCVYCRILCPAASSARLCSALPGPGRAGAWQEADEWLTAGRLPPSAGPAASASVTAAAAAAGAGTT